MKFKDLKKRAPTDLEKEMSKSEFELMKYRAQVATGGAGKDTGKIRQLRRTIAKIKTIQKEVKPKA